MIFADEGKLRRWFFMLLITHLVDNIVILLLTFRFGLGLGLGLRLAFYDLFLYRFLYRLFCFFFCAPSFLAPSIPQQPRPKSTDK
jgi:hypothetical protein